MLSFLLILCSIFLAVGLKNYKNIHSNIAVFIVLFVLLFLFVGTITAKVILPIYSYDITIEVTEEKNQNALGCDIGIKSIKIGSSNVNLSDSDVKQGWLYSYNILSWHYSGNKQICLSVPIYVKTEIVFVKNIWAGIANVIVDNQADRIDLYSNIDTTFTYSIEKASFVEIIKKMWQLFILLILEFILLLILVIYINKLINKKINGREMEFDLIKIGKNVLKNNVELSIRILVTFISFLLMLCFAGKVSLWADDLATISFVAENVDLKTVVERILSDAGSNPPLFYLIACVWLRLAPYGTIFLKIPSMVFSCLGIWFCGVAAKRIYGERAAVIATIFAGTSYFLFNYAAFTFRAYGLLFLLCSLLIIAYHRRLIKPYNISSHILYGIVLTLMLYTHYYSILIIGILGLFDLWLFLNKKIKFNCILSYLASISIFVPFFLLSFKYIYRNAGDFWPDVPNLNTLFSTINLLFNGQWFMILLFCIGIISTVLLLCEKKYANAFCDDSASNIVLMQMSIWVVGLLALVYIYSHYINPEGSLFVARYFIAAFAPAVIVTAVALERLLIIVCDKKDQVFSRILAVCIIASCFITNGYKQIEDVSKFPGVINQPFEQAIDWIYDHANAHYSDTLVMMTTYQDGLYYYATHSGERENLNFGFLTNENWQNYNIVYASQMHGTFSDENKNILAEHFSEIERNDALNVVVYRKEVE